MKLHLYRKDFVQNYWFWTTHGKVVLTHYPEGTSSYTMIQVNNFNHNYDGNEVGGYNDHDMETMLNDAFRYEEIALCLDVIVNVDTFL